MQAALNAANTGTHALENAANSISGVVADLDTMIIFASAGTLDTDNEIDTFAGICWQQDLMIIREFKYYFI